MRAGRFVGRVGELAAVLGVGAVISLAAPTAWADDTATSRGGSDSSSSSADSSSGKSAERESEREADEPSTRSEPGEPSHEEPRGRREPDNDSSGSPRATAHTEASDDADDPAADGPDAHEDEADADYAGHDLEEPESVTVAMTAAPATTVPDPPPTPPDHDGSGEAPPIDWVVAAAARRELDTTERSSIAPAAQAPSAQTAAAAVAPEVTELGNFTVPGSLADYPAGSPVVNAAGTRAVIATAASHWLTGKTTRVVVVNPTTGARIGSAVTLSGTPTGAPILNAAGTRALITATTSSWLTGTTTRATIIDTATGARVGSTVTLTGTPFLASQLSTDGARALVTTSSYSWFTRRTTTRATLVNTGTGARVGSAVAVAGSPAAALITADGARAVVATYSTIFDPANNKVQVAVLNAATGAQLGTTVAVAGGPSGQPLLLTHGARALIATENIDPATNDTTTRVAVVNLSTGAQVGSTLARAGRLLWPQLNTAGTRALVVTSVQDTATDVITNRVTSIDAATGAVIGAEPTFVGDPTVLLASADVSRAVLATVTFDQATQTESTRIAVVDTATGSQTGTTVTIPGTAYAPVLQHSSTDGTRALITTFDRDVESGVTTVRAAVINTSTGQQTGSTVTLPDLMDLTALLWRPDGTRAAFVTATANGTQVSVVNTTTSDVIGTAALDGMASSALLSPDLTRAVVTTTVGTNTRVAAVDLTAGVVAGIPADVGGAVIAEPIALTANGTRLLVKTAVQTAAGRTVRVAVVDTPTGTQVGAATTLPGVLLWPVTSADGSHSLITSFDPATGTTHLAAFDSAAGTVADTITLTGFPSGPPILSADGTRAMVTVRTYSQWTGYTTRVVTLQLA